MTGPSLDKISSSWTVNTCTPQTRGLTVPVLLIPSAVWYPLAYLCLTFCCLCCFNLGFYALFALNWHSVSFLVADDCPSWELPGIAHPHPGFFSALMARTSGLLNGAWAHSPQLCPSTPVCLLPALFTQLTLSRHAKGNKYNYHLCYMIQMPNVININFLCASHEQNTQMHRFPSFAHSS